MTNKSKHTGVGLALGAALGAAFGVMAGHVGAWLAIGVAIGMLLGASFRRKGTECPECAQIHRAHELRNQGTKLGANS
jgi:H+/Cl- antiporter ClcA